MSMRRIRRRINGLFYERSHSRPFRLSAEEMAWLNVVPVGREFGSPDYDRLVILDMFTSGQLTAQDAMHQLGVDEIQFAAMVEKAGLLL